jgi:hypothetical protein
MHRCYDPGRMSNTPVIDDGRSGVSSIFGALAWVALAAVLALGGAGLVGELTHPPGGPSRAELTFAGDQLLAARLDDADSRLRQIADNVDKMSQDAKTALEDLAATDTDGLQKALQHGSGIAIVITAATVDLRNSLAGLPGDEPDAVLQFSNATLVRRAAILAALDAAGGLAKQWQDVTGRSVDAARLTGLLQDHDKTVGAAIALALDHCLCKFADAVTTLNAAKATLTEIDGLKAEFSGGSEVTVLDAWLVSHTRYDDALIKLYHAIDVAHGKNTLEVQAANREEQIARGLLPTDNRSIVVIVAQFARGGLNQAVVAIEDAGGRIDNALAEAPPV